MAELFCEQCGHGPYNDPRGLASHVIAHEVVICDVCEQPRNRRGIGPHRKSCLAAYEAVAASALAETTHGRHVIGLRDLTPPQFGEEALERAALLLDKHPEHRGLFIVAGTSYGPHLTSRQNVGGIVAKAHEPCLVIDLDLLPAPALSGKPAAWPHARRG